MNQKKMKKYFLKYKKQNIKDVLLAKVVSKSTKSEFNFIKREKAEQGKSAIFDKVMNLYDLGKISEKNRMVILPQEYSLVYLNSNIRKTKKDWKELKEIIIRDYQQKLEQDLSKKLHNRHNVKIYEDVLKSLEY